MKIVFAGTPEFSVPPLRELIEQGHHILAVYTQPDKPAGRGQKVSKSPIKVLAESHNIPVIQVKSLKSTEAHEQMQSLSPELMVVVAYGLIIPQNILDIPVHGCWNIHASILPRWRGAAPIHRAILAGDEQTGISIMQMEAGLDTGPVYRIYPTDIRPDDTGQSLHDRLSEMGAEAISTCINELIEQRLPEAKTQDDDLVCYAHKLKKPEAQVNWNQDAKQIERQIRAFKPWPGSVATIKGESYKLWQAQVMEDNSSHPPGDIISASKNHLQIKCKNHSLTILEIQKAGKKRILIKQFMAAKSAWYS